MPFYEYKCRQCGARFEEMVSLSRREEEERELTCPECGARGPERQISTFAAPTSHSSTGTPNCSSGG